MDKMLFQEVISMKYFRDNKKKDKEANHKNLQDRGMLPGDGFDYKNVDFTSFQGGSRTHRQELRFQAQNKVRSNYIAISLV